MKLIVDAGATKAQWALSGGKRFLTEGLNFAHMPEEKLRLVLSEAAEKSGPGVTEVHFFAAGLVGESPVRLEEFFPGADVEYASDMVGAARALFGRGRGVAAIIGTGANTCLWDGTGIRRQFRSGGYVIGDEGSAAALGRLFLSDYVKGLVPEALASAFGASYADIVREIYASPSPARYLGSIAPFLLERYADPYVKSLIDNNFRAFFERTVCRYGPSSLGVVGGFGFAAREILRSVGRECGIELETVMPSPMEGLLRYYGI